MNNVLKYILAGVLGVSYITSYVCPLAVAQNSSAANRKARADAVKRLPFSKTPSINDKEAYDTRSDAFYGNDFCSNENGIPDATLALISKAHDKPFESLESVLEQIKPGAILILGEDHESEEHKRLETAIISSLGKRMQLAIGLELFFESEQKKLDSIQDPNFDIPKYSATSVVKQTGRVDDYIDVLSAINSCQNRVRIIALNPDHWSSKQKGSTYDCETRSARTIAEYHSKNPDDTMIIVYRLGHLLDSRLDLIVNNELRAKGEYKNVIVGILGVGDAIGRYNDEIKDLSIQKADYKSFLSESLSRPIDHVDFLFEIFSPRVYNLKK
ncbi:MAG: ChaN family lipoprotein [Nanoarchaeota archaeon]